MKNIIPILLASLVPAIKTATGKTCHTRIPEAEGVTYPYIFISDKYQSETGPKTSYTYEIDILIQLVYMNATSLVPLYTDMDNILQLVNNASPSFTLTGGYKIESCTLAAPVNDLESQTETGVQNVGLIRLLFTIK